MKHWYNNGEISKQCEVCPDGFVAGRINKKLTEVELKNKLLVEEVLNKYSSEDLIEYYMYHNIKETLNYFNITNARILKKVLTQIGYDFSKAKPSKFKGKSAARSHDSYVASGVKSATTQKENWEKKSDEEKTQWSNKQKEAHSSTEYRSKISEINKKYQQNLTVEEKELIKQKKQKSNKETWNKNKTKILAKAHATRKEQKSFNSSKPEDNYYNLLLEKYGKEDVVRHYSSDLRYPHECDFYIKSKDLFIELNLSWTHGGHRFNSNDPADIARLSLMKEKALTSDYYKKAIDTWTRLDVSKFEDAEKNNLNYIVFYTEEEAFANVP